VLSAPIRRDHLTRPGSGTAVDAAPYLLDDEEAAGEITPEKAFETLKPFKDLVADDIRSGSTTQREDD